jgi:hypothetical protein
MRARPRTMNPRPRMRDPVLDTHTREGENGTIAGAMETSKAKRFQEYACMQTYKD